MKLCKISKKNVLNQVITEGVGVWGSTVYEGNTGRD